LSNVKMVADRHRRAA